jgi:ATP-dependent exoDNAse (exonuclease V) beta subunit
MSSVRHVLISASAGTGKTFQLSNRYISLLARGASPDQILATTFTRKAAGEILDRVVVRLAEATLSADRHQELIAHVDAPCLSQDACAQLLEQVLRQVHRLRISTLDAFFAQLAGSFSLELGLPTPWRIMEALQEKYLRSEAIELTLQENTHQDAQRLVHLMAKGTALRSVSDLVRGTVQELYDLYLETDAAAWQQIPQPRLLPSGELAELIEALRTADLPVDKRFENARARDLDAAAVSDWEAFIGGGLAAKVLEQESTYYRKPIPADVVKIYRRLIDQAKAVLLDQMARQTQATYELLDKFHALYARLKHRARALRFEDVTRALVAGQRPGDLARQHFRLDAPIEHLLLDEFQDTSLPQWRVLEPLARFITAANSPPAAGAHRAGASFFCVGDTKQAIYAWRGGKADIFDALPAELPDLTQESLTTSFRSAPAVIETVNRVFSQLTRHGHLERFHEPVAAWCAKFPQHTTARQGLPGYAELWSAPDGEAGDSPDDVKLAAAAGRIAELTRSAPGCSIGVLTRRNAVVSQLIYELRRRRVPASEEGGNPLTDSAAVQLVLSLLKLADHPGDTVARFHVARSPLATPLAYPDHRDDARTLALARLVRVRLLHDGYGRALEQWAELLEPNCQRRDVSRLEQLVDLAYGYQPLATLRTSDFLRYVELERVADPTAADVRVMTVHQAKGLQFDIVVLPDLDAQLVGQSDACVVGQSSPTGPIDRVCLYRNASIQKLLPAELQRLFEAYTRQSMEEALCVLYVSLTRAIHALYMIVRPSTSSERNLPRTSAGLLRAALTDGQPLPGDVVAYQHGDPQWYAQLPRRPPAASTEVAVDRHIELAPLPDHLQLEWTSPSQLEGGHRIRADRLLDLSGGAGAARGTLIHAWFEQITWLDDNPPTHNSLRRIAHGLDTAGLDVEQQLAAFDSMLQMDDVAAVLRRSFYQSSGDPDLQQCLAATCGSEAVRAEVFTERRFAVRDGQHLLSGVIDRLVLIYRGTQLVAADIIDYKTDAARREDTDRLDELWAYYRPQIEAYRRAVATMFRLPQTQIMARLLFVTPGVRRDVPMHR